MATAKKPAARNVAVKKTVPKKAAAKAPTTRKAAVEVKPPRAPAAGRPVAARPVAARPVAARPVAARPVAAKPVAAKPAAPAPRAIPKAAPKLAKPQKAPKFKKIKPVRDSFTMPKAEYAALDTLKLRAARLASAVKKSELLRAGVKALTAMSDAEFLAAVKAVPTIKTGRPAAR